MYSNYSYRMTKLNNQYVRKSTVYHSFIRYDASKYKKCLLIQTISLKWQIVCLCIKKNVNDMFEKNNLYGICVHMDLLEAFFTRKYHMTSHMSSLSSLNVREGVCLCTYNKQETYTRQHPRKRRMLEWISLFICRNNQSSKVNVCKTHEYQISRQE